MSLMAQMVEPRATAPACGRRKKLSTVVNRSLAASLLSGVLGACKETPEPIQGAAAREGGHELDSGADGDTQDSGMHGTQEVGSGTSSEVATGESTSDAGSSGCGGETPGRLLWTHSYWDPTSINLSGMYQLLSGDDVLVATGTLATQDGSKGWLAKLDATTHEVVWQDLVMPTSAECLATLLSDGGLFAGCTVTVHCPPGTNWHDCDNDVVFRRYAADDSLLWEDKFSSVQNKGNDVTSGGFVETPDGDIIVPYDVSTAGDSSDPSRAHLRRYTATGEQLWDKELSFGQTGTNLNLSSLVGTSDGASLFAAGQALARTSVAKLNADGEVQWLVPQQDGRNLYDLATVGQNVAAVGAEGSGVERMGVVEVFSPNGESILVTHFAGNRAYANAVAGTPDGRLFVAVVSEEGSEEMANSYVVELTLQGEEVWRTNGFGDSLNVISGLSVSDDCTLLAAGRRWEGEEGYWQDAALGGELEL